MAERWLSVEHTVLMCLSEAVYTDLSAQHFFQKLNSLVSNLEVTIKELMSHE